MLRCSATGSAPLTQSTVSAASSTASVTPLRRGAAVSKESSSSSSRLNEQSTTVTAASRRASSSTAVDRARPKLRPSVGPRQPGEHPQVRSHRPREPDQCRGVQLPGRGQPGRARQTRRLVEQPEHLRDHPAVDVRVHEHRRDTEPSHLVGDPDGDGRPSRCAGRAPDGDDPSPPGRPVVRFVGHPERGQCSPRVGDVAARRRRTRRPPPAAPGRSRRARRRPAGPGGRRAGGAGRPPGRRRARPGRRRPPRPPRAGRSRRCRDGEVRRRAAPPARCPWPRPRAARRRRRSAGRR